MIYSPGFGCHGGCHTTSRVSVCACDCTSRNSAGQGENQKGNGSKYSRSLGSGSGLGGRPADFARLVRDCVVSLISNTNGDRFNELRKVCNITKRWKGIPRHFTTDREKSDENDGGTHTMYSNALQMDTRNPRGTRSSFWVSLCT